ncbi:MFS transporter [Curvivirga aplysinae]|uniref:MFS transporter n=1 Tax=Curvivirga aplysinae TaxID=2529852 RepID=UPI0012BBC384|nr:MFS transporter [Curvivirga aplysinae]MTI09989.1 MFS transporter [Curvivirga aplysinae]
MSGSIDVKLSYKNEYIAITGALVSMFLGGVAFGMSLPLLPLVMHRWGLGEAMIGYNGMAQSLALFSMCLIVVKVFRKFHMLPTMLVASAIMVVGSLALIEFQSWFGWFLIRLFIGGAFAFMWIGFEVWVNHLAPEHQRGRILAIYAGCFAAPTALGPLVLNYVGTEGDLPFYVIAALYGLGALPMLVGYKMQPNFRAEEKVKLLSMVRVMPFLILCAAMAGLGDGAAWNMMSLFGVKVGLSESSALMLSSTFLLGSFILQFPIGYLADKINRMKLLILVTAIGAVACAGVALSAVNGIAFWSLTFVAGGMLMGVYVLALAVLGQRFKGGTMAAANAVFVIVFELGTFTGGPISGGLMEYIHPSSLLWMMGFACLVLTVAAITSRRLQPPKTA